LCIFKKILLKNKFVQNIFKMQFCDSVEFERIEISLIISKEKHFGLTLVLFHENFMKFQMKYILTLFKFAG